MEMSAEHILLANIGNTDSLLSILSYQPVDNPIPQVYILKAEIGSIADQDATSI